MTSGRKARIAWVDFIEALAIFFVVLYHGPLYQWNFQSPEAPLTSVFYYLFNGILSTAVPLFFLVNGYLLFSKPLNPKKHFYKTIKLIFLTLAWEVITTGLYAWFDMKPTSIRNWASIVWHNWELWTPHLWFMQSLVCIYILLPVLKLVFDHNKKVFIYLIGMIALLTFGVTLMEEVRTILNINFADTLVLTERGHLSMMNPFAGIKWWTLVYFGLGGLIFCYRDKIMQVPTKLRNLASIGGIIVNCILLFGLGVFYSRRAGTTWDIVYDAYGTIFTLCNTLCIFLLGLNYTANNKFITMVSRNTLSIYFIHMIIIHFTCSRAAPLIKLMIFTLPTSLVYSFAVLGVSLMIGLLLQKLPLLKKLL